jgi:hypothetical protein
MSAPMTDANALNETLAAVEAEVAAGTGRFVQGTYVWATPCGAAGCFAGWRAFQDGYTEVHESGEYLVNPKTGAVLPVYAAGGSAFPRTGTTVALYAMRRFGLDRDEAHLLFDGENTLADIREMVAALTKENTDARTDD